MRGTNRTLRALLTVGLVLALQACAEGNLDSANVVLVISSFPPIPAVTTTEEDGSCTFLVPTNTSVTLKSLPKTDLAESPFSDVVVESAVVSYTWDDGLIVGPIVQSTAGYVPCEGTGTVAFLPIQFGDLTADRAGHSANLTVTFRGRTVDGVYIESVPGPPGGATISVESCDAAPIL